MSHLLEVTGLTTTFGTGENTVAVVNDVNITVEKGKTLVLLGESGSGKSITALSIMRLLPQSARITAGDVFLDGESLFRLTERSMRSVRGGQIGMIFQEPQTSLNPVLTAGQQIGETLKEHQGLVGKDQIKRSIELLNAVGIPEPERRVHEYPHQFSGGMKQRIMIAMALAGEPQLLIADEPTTAVDVTIQAQVLELLKNLQAETGMGILFITHDLGVASVMADDIAVMYHGEIVEKNTSDAFFSNPQHEYSRHLFKSLPNRDKRIRDDKDLVPPPDRKDHSPLLSVEKMKVHFPIRKGLFKRVVGYVKAVDGVSIEIFAGETVAVVGESGSGKTTMGKGILQLLQVTAGDVVFNHEQLNTLDPATMRKRRADIQIVFQDPFASMNPRMMVADIIEEGMLAQNIGTGRDDRQEKIDKLLLDVGLKPEHKLRYPHEFSGGQRQRICIARALAVNPKLVICDEPTSALDVSVQAQILDLLKELQSRLGLAYLFITHNIGVVEYLAHYVAVMYQGEIVEQGPVEEVLYQPKHSYTQKLLAAVPVVRTGTEK